MERILNANRVVVNNDYESAELNNMEKHLNGSVKHGAEYIYANQKQDAVNIVNLFYKSEVKVVSVLKKTKLGMDGLMIEISKQFATHTDNKFALHRSNIFVITGMSNVLWEEDMKEKMPNCFKNNVFHHGKLEQFKKKISNIKNALIIIDEIDTGDKKYQRIDLILKNCGILDLSYINDNNIRFVFVSATSINQTHELHEWGAIHRTYKMTIPDNYIGHQDFLDKDIIKEFYPVNCLESCEMWVKDDIIDNYGTDYRIHIIRMDDDSSKIMKDVCNNHGIDFKNHSCSERIDTDELSILFANVLSKHLVISIKGFYRRANYIPNEWKLKIGATHEKFTKQYDTSVQVQGLPGRMTGYWKKTVMDGHKTGPYRTSIDAMKEYDTFYNNPVDLSVIYSTSFKDSFVSKQFIKNFKGSNKKMCIPIMVNCSKTLLDIKSKKAIITYITELISNQSDKLDLLQFITDKHSKCLKILRPKTAKQNFHYNSDVINAYNNNIPYSNGNGIKEDSDDTEIERKKNYQMFIDIIEYKAYFILQV